MPNQAQFANQSPDIGQLRVLYRDLPSGEKTIKAITISTGSLEGININTSLKELEQIRFIIDSSGSVATINTGLGSRVDGYYYFDAEDFNVTAVSSSAEYQTIVNISPYLTEKFRNSNYDALLSNASEIRRSNFRYDVDRLEANNITSTDISGSTILPVRPTNWLSLISGSATLAEVQDSNYTTTGIVNARYAGTKTDKNQYGGIKPAIGAAGFEASAYLISTADSFICSQSLSDRTVETYYTDGNPDTLSSSIAPTVGILTSGITPASSSINYSINSGSFFETGQILQLDNGAGTTEFIEVTNVTPVTAVTGVINVRRAVDGGTVETFAGGNAIKPVISSKIFTVEGSKVVPVSSKKFWIKETRTVVVTGDRGKVVTESSICTI